MEEGIRFVERVTPVEAHADELIAAGLKPAIAPPADGQGNTGTQVSTSDELSPDEVAKAVLGR